MPDLNILFITGDQWRHDALSALGHPVVETPNLDALAADGVLFKRHFTNASPCGPSRSSLHTGLYLMTHRSGRNGTPLDARFTNWAKELRKAGYDPGLIGYTDISPDPRAHAEGDPALKTYEGVLPGLTPHLVMASDRKTWLAYLRRRGYDVPPAAAEIYTPQTEDLAMAETRGPSFPPGAFKAEDSDTAFTTDAALDYITARADGAWCLHLSHLRPHPPLVAPDPWHDLYKPDRMPGSKRQASVEAEGLTHPWLAWHLGRKLGLGSMPEHHQAQAKATYFGLIAEMDHHLGRLIGHLKRSGQYDRTLIVFTADHGEMLGDHWYTGKDGFFDPAFRVPMIVKPLKAEPEARWWMSSPSMSTCCRRSATSSGSRHRTRPTASRSARSLRASCRRPGGGRCISNTTSGTWSTAPRRPRWGFAWTNVASPSGGASASNMCTSPACPRCSSTCRRIRTSCGIWPATRPTRAPCWKPPRGCFPIAWSMPNAR